MVFVTVDEDRIRLNNMTELLIRTFPGSVIYQYTDLIHAVIHMEKADDILKQIVERVEAPLPERMKFRG